MFLSRVVRVGSALPVRHPAFQTTMRLTLNFFTQLVAVAFAKRGANIYIAGRNEEAANKVLSKCRAASTFPEDDKQIFVFRSFDASSLEDCKRFATDMQRHFEMARGLHFLVMTQGGIGNGERKDTVDGNEWSVSNLLAQRAC